MAIVGASATVAEQVGLRWLHTHENEIARSIERLATGKRINRASDDPEGFITSEGLKGEQRGVLLKIQQNQRDGYRYGAVEGGLSVVSDLLNDLKSDIVSASNGAGTTEAERKAYQIDADS